MPLLSQPVMEACLAAPCWMWISGGRNRAVARDAFADLLPLDVLSRRSKGTFMSYLGAVYQKNKEQMRDFLLTGHLQAHGLLDADAVQSRIESRLPPRDESFTRIFELCMTENWVRHQV
jgi:asparagine synthase (glutamine-hydrolysing)